MGKADILNFFAGLNLAVFIIAAGYFIIEGANALVGGTGSMMIGFGLLFSGLFQYAILGGAAEVIKRLVSIDEKTTSQPPVQPAETPVARVATGEVGRAGR